jgi:hypothetical protein
VHDDLVVKKIFTISLYTTGEINSSWAQLAHSEGAFEGWHNEIIYPYIFFLAGILEILGSNYY